VQTWIAPGPAWAQQTLRPKIRPARRDATLQAPRLPARLRVQWRRARSPSGRYPLLDGREQPESSRRQRPERCTAARGEASTSFAPSVLSLGYSCWIQYIARGRYALDGPSGCFVARAANGQILGSNCLHQLHFDLLGPAIQHRDAEAPNLAGANGFGLRLAG
jgi:hypothetical protein